MARLRLQGKDPVSGRGGARYMTNTLFQVHLWSCGSFYFFEMEFHLITPGWPGAGDSPVLAFLNAGITVSGSMIWLSFCLYLFPCYIIYGD